MIADKEITGTVLEIQRMSTEDGPGIRSTVFLKGCSLACRWCHNPESISSKPQVHWIGSRCIGCLLCVPSCPSSALASGPGGIAIDRSLCTGCGTCAEVCPSTALEMLGTAWTAEALVKELVKDRAFFEKSGGGVTLSGGEASLQARFAGEVLSKLKSRGIHTALDTCGQTSLKILEQLMPQVDLILFDIKEISPGKHKEFTGTSNELILENLLGLVSLGAGAPGGPSLWIRTPIIPGDTDRVDNIQGIARFLTSQIPSAVTRWELCTFNNLCQDKYARLEMPWPYQGIGLSSRETMDKLVSAAVRAGFPRDRVQWTGSVALDREHSETTNPVPRPRTTC